MQICYVTCRCRVTVDLGLALLVVQITQQLMATLVSTSQS